MKTNHEEAQMYSLGEIVKENGGYSYEILGQVPCKCWSLHKPDLKKLKKTLERLNNTKLRQFNSGKQKDDKKS